MQLARLWAMGQLMPQLMPQLTTHLTTQSRALDRDASITSLPPQL